MCSRFLFLLFFLNTFSLFSQSEEYIKSQYQKAEDYHLNRKNDSTIFTLVSLLNYLDEYNNELSIKSKAETYDQLGLYYQKYGEWIKSAVAYNNGLQLIEESNRNLDEESKEYFDVSARLNLHLGLLYVKAVGITNSEFYLNIAKELAEEENNYPVLFALHKEESKENRDYKDGLKFSKEIKNNQYLSNYYYLLANNYLDSDLDIAKVYFDSARFVMPILEDAKLQHFQFHAFFTDYFLRLYQDDSASHFIDSASFHCDKAEKISYQLNDIETDKHFWLCKISMCNIKGDTLESKLYSSLQKEILDEYLIEENTLKGYLNSELDNQKQSVEQKKLKSFLEILKKVGIATITPILLIFIVVYISIRKIRKKNKELKESNESRDRLFSIISHDLRGAVSSIKNLSKSESNINKIRNASDSLLLEFDSLLHWSAKHLDNLEYNPKIIDVNEKIDEILSLSSFQSDLKMIDIEICFTEELIVYADENMFKVILRNIINNAIKYSKPDSKIKITAVEEGKILSLSIKDSGFGFKHNYTNKGLGLGLELCKDFLEINNGELIIESSKSGSVITIELPIEKPI